MTHARVIVNPAAGAGRGARIWPDISAQLKGLGLHFEHDFSHAPGHAAELAKLAAAKGYKLVVAVGGDGTIHEIVNGLYEANALGDVALGIVSAGTGCDCTRTFGIPRHHEEACRHLMNPGRLSVDIGVVEYSASGQTVKRLFLNNAGVGFDAEVVKKTMNKPRALGARYFLAVVSNWLPYRSKMVSMTVDGATAPRKITTVMVCNGKYLAAGMRFAPDADPSDGLLDVVTIGDMKKVEFIWVMPQVYKGTHVRHAKVSVEKARDIEIACKEPLPVEADGELLGETPVKFSVLPGALKVVV